jgi:hypothetical protein
MVLGTYQNQISQLPSLSINRYEQIFRLYTTNSNQFYYNLLQNVYIVDNIDPKAIFYITVKQQLPWSIVSYNTYGTIDLWWLIALVNNIYNPVKLPDAGSVIKAIRPEYVTAVLKEINTAITSK